MFEYFNKQTKKKFRKKTILQLSEIRTAAISLPQEHYCKGMLA